MGIRKGLSYDQSVAVDDGSRIEASGLHQNREKGVFLAVTGK